MTPTRECTQMPSLPNINAQFLSKCVIVCPREDDGIIQAFHKLLQLHSLWSQHVALVFLTCDIERDNKNVYYYNQRNYENIRSIAAVEVIITSKDKIVLQNTMGHQLQVDSKDTTSITKALKASLYTQPLDTTTLSTTYKITKERLFLFDYDGTLTPIVSNPADAQPTPTLLQYLGALCKDPNNTVWIISGRDQFFLDTYLGKIPRLGLSAEHGSFMKKAGLEDWTDMLKDADMSWKGVALSIFENYTHSNPGTVIEQKKSSITWHYRNAADTEEAEKQSELCHQELLKIPGVDILVGKMNLEVRSLLVNKGEVVKRIKQSQPDSDFIMCAGDDSTDEDMFRALSQDEQAFTVSVGPLSKKTSAKYCVEHSENIVNILGQLVEDKLNRL